MSFTSVTTTNLIGCRSLLNTRADLSIISVSSLLIPQVTTQITTSGCAGIFDLKEAYFVTYSLKNERKKNSPSHSVIAVQAGNDPVHTRARRQPYEQNYNQKTEHKEQNSNKSHLELMLKSFKLMLIGAHFLPPQKYAEH